MRYLRVEERTVDMMKSNGTRGGREGGWTTVDSGLGIGFKYIYLLISSDATCKDPICRLFLGYSATTPKDKFTFYRAQPPRDPKPCAAHDSVSHPGRKAIPDTSL